MRIALLALLLLPGLGATACGKIVLVNGNSSADLASNDSLLAQARAAPVDQPVSGTPVFAPLVGIGVALSSVGSSDPKGMTLSYLWKVIAAPTGSTINDAALINATSQSASFVPDRGGAYQIELTITTTDQRTGKAALTVTAQTSPIFYTSLELSAQQFAAKQRLVRSDGTGVREVSCGVTGPFNDDEDSSFSVEAYGAFLLSRTYYPKADPISGLIGPARFAFSLAELNQDLAKGMRWGLRLASEETDCANKPPVSVTRAAEGAPSQPRFSPTGDRFVFNTLADSGKIAAAATVLISSTGEASQLMGTSPGTPYVVVGTSPAWLDNTTLILTMADITTDAKNPKWRFYRAKLDGSSLSELALYADCSSVSPTWFSMERVDALPGGGLVVSARTKEASDFPQFGFDLYRIAAPPTGTTTCTVTSLTAASSDNYGAARDWELSPDGKKLVYTRIEPELAQLPLDAGYRSLATADIWIMEVDSPVSAKKLAGDLGNTDVGPHFINNGRQVTWTQGPPASVLSRLPGDLASPLVAAYKGISVINVDGTNERSLVGGSGQFGSNGPELLSTPLGGTGWTFLGCNIDPLANPMSSVVLGFLIAGAIALSARRRRR